MRSTQTLPTGMPSALDLAADVHTGRRSATTIVREHLARIADADAQLNAFQYVLAESAVAEAASIDADPNRRRLPLAGVPVAVKDNIAVRGVPTRHGSAATSDRPVVDDDLLVQRLRAVGCVVIGTTRMPELAAWPFTSSTAYGITRNPLDPALEPGGSTGGGAVAVAAGMAALAIGTDGGGSLRVPAAYCGLIGLKPTRGLVPLAGGLTEHWQGCTVTGPIARTASDAGTLLAVLSGTPITEPATPEPLRVAISMKSPSPIGRADDQQRAAVRHAAQLLSDHGHRVQPADPAYPADLLDVWVARWLAGIADDADRLGVDVARLERRTRTMIIKGRRKAPRTGAAWEQGARAFFGDHDLLVTPVTARRPSRAGSLQGKGFLATYLASARTAPFAQAWNLAGYPAIAVPVGWRAGLPLAVQLIAPPGQEERLLGMAAQLTARVAG